MTVLEFVESGMTFGPFSEIECFRIEKSLLYAAINKNSKEKEGIKIAEFILLRKRTPQDIQIWVVEAKKSSPRPETQLDFDAFIAEIREKLVNAFSLCWAACLKRHQGVDSELPESIRNLDLATTDIRFFLVINGHEDSWLPPLQDALNKALRVTVKIWAFSPNSVAVINDKLAREKGLIR